MRFSLKTILSLFVTLCAGIGQGHAAELMYVTMNNGNIVTYDISLGSATAVQASQQIFSSSISTANGIAIDSTGNVYAASYGYGNITKFTPNGIGTTFATVQGPNGLTFDNFGNLYAANAFTGNSIEKITPNGTRSKLANISSPNDLVSDSSGNIYASNSSIGASNSYIIRKITPGGTVSTFFSSPKTYGGLTIDSSGNLYSRSFDNISSSIIKITPGGAYSTFITGLSRALFKTL